MKDFFQRGQDINKIYDGKVKENGYEARRKRDVCPIR
jgi:hypothetical protein